MHKIIEKAIANITEADGFAIALMGSYARKKEKAFSDIDIVCFVDQDGSDPHIQVIDHKYVVISQVDKRSVDQWVEDPVLATEFIPGLRNMISLRDPDHYLKNLQERAQRFQWTPELQSVADHFAAKELLLLGEEVNKGIQGIIDADTGRMLNSLLGLSLNLAKILRVQKGILLQSDNDFYDVLESVYAHDVAVVGLIRSMFGLTPDPLSRRTQCALAFYRQVVTELEFLFEGENKQIVDQLLSNISTISN